MSSSAIQMKLVTENDSYTHAHIINFSCMFLSAYNQKRRQIVDYILDRYTL